MIQDKTVKQDFILILQAGHKGVLAKWRTMGLILFISTGYLLFKRVDSRREETNETECFSLFLREG